MTGGRQPAGADPPRRPLGGASTGAVGIVEAVIGAAMMWVGPAVIAAAAVAVPSIAGSATVVSQPDGPMSGGRCSGVVPAPSRIRRPRPCPSRSRGAERRHG
jgi:hypothetical protein